MNTCHMSQKASFVISYVLGFLCLERSKLLHMTGNAIKVLELIFLSLYDNSFTAPQLHIGELELI